MLAAGLVLYCMTVTSFMSWQSMAVISNSFESMRKTNQALSAVPHLQFVNVFSFTKHKHGNKLEVYRTDDNVRLKFQSANFKSRGTILTELPSMDKPIVIRAGTRQAFYITVQVNNGLSSRQGIRHGIATIHYTRVTVKSPMRQRYRCPDLLMHLSKQPRHTTD